MWSDSEKATREQPAGLSASASEPSSCADNGKTTLSSNKSACRSGRSPTRSNTTPSPSNLTSDCVRLESRKVLEKYLEQQLPKNSSDSAVSFFSETTVSSTVFGSAPSSSRDAINRNTSPNKFDVICEETRQHFTSLKFSKNDREIVDFSKKGDGELKSSQSTSSSGDEKVPSKNINSKSEEASVSSAVSTPSDADPSSKKFPAAVVIAPKKKKSFFKRAKERLERTLSLRKNNVQNEADQQKVDGKKKARFLTTALRDPQPPPWRRQRAPDVVRSNSDDSSSAKNSRHRVKFAEETTEKNLKKTTKKRKKMFRAAPPQTPAQPPSSAETFLTPPDSKPRFSTKEKTTIFTGLRLLKKRSSSGSSSSVTKLQSTEAEKRRRVERDRSVTSRRNLKKLSLDDRDGLKSLAEEANGGAEKTNGETSGILHRCSGEYEEKARRFGNENDMIRKSSVDIKIQPPSSSENASASLSPPWSLPGDASVKSDLTVPSNSQNLSTSSQEERRRDSDESLEEKYSLIAKRLAELGDAYLSTQWTQLGSQVEESQHCVVVDDPAAGVNITRSTSVEREIIFYINNVGNELDNGNNFVQRLANSSNAHQFGAILNNVTIHIGSSDVNWTQLALIFYCTKAAVRAVGASTSAASRLVEFCCDYVACKFSDWIIGRGGWLSVVEDSSTGDEKS